MLVTATLLLVFREVRRYKVLQSVTDDMEVLYYSVTCFTSKKVQILTVTGDMETFLDICHSCIDSETHFAPAVSDLKSLERTADSLLDMGLGSPDYHKTRSRAEILSYLCLDTSVTSLDQLYTQVFSLLALLVQKYKH